MFLNYVHPSPAMARLLSFFFIALFIQLGASQLTHHFDHNTKPHVIFKQTGTVYVPHDVTIVQFHIDTTIMIKACDDSLTNIDLLRHKIAQHKDYYNDPTHLFLTRDADRLKEHIQNTCQTPWLLKKQRDLNNDRQDRSPALILLGAGAIVSTGLGLYSAAQVQTLTSTTDRLNTRLNNQLLILKDHESRLDNLNASWAITTSGLTDIINVLHLQFDTAPYTKATNLLFKQFSVVAHFIDAFEQGYTQLMNSKLSLQLISPNKLVAVWRQIKRKAKRSTLLFDSPLQLLQLPSTFLLHNNLTLTVYLHVPLAQTELTLYKYVPFPIHQNNDAFPIIIEPTKPFLAIGANHKLHLELSPTDLDSSCYRFLGTYVCDDIPLFLANPATSCLGALFTKTLNNITTLCPLSQFTGQFAAEATNNDTLLVYVAEPTSYTGACGTKLIPATSLRRYTTIHLRPECHISSQFFHIQATAMSAIQQTVAYPIHISLPTLHQGITTTKLKQIADRLRHHNIEPSTDVKRLLEQDTFNSANTLTSSLPFLSIVGILAIVTIAVCIIIAILCYLRRRQSRRRHNNAAMRFSDIEPKNNIHVSVDAHPLNPILRQRSPEPRTSRTSRSSSRRPSPPSYKSPKPSIRFRQEQEDSTSYYDNVFP